MSDVVVGLVPAVLGVYQAVSLAEAEVGAHGRLVYGAVPVAAGALLLLRRYCPLLTLVAVVAVVALSLQFRIPLSNSSLFAVALGLYSQAAYTRRVPAWVGWLSSLPVPVGFVLALPADVRVSVLGELGATFAGVHASFGLVSYAGQVQRQRRALSETLTDRALQLGDQANQLATVGAVEERARIARDLQRIVIAAVDEVRARIARARGALTGGADDGSRAIDDIAKAGRGALVEMRRLLGVLRVEDVDTSDAVIDLDRLVEEGASAGVMVSFDVRVAVNDLPVVVRHAFRRFVEVAVGLFADAAPARNLTIVASPSVDGLQLLARADHDDDAPSASPVPVWDPALSALAERMRVLGGHLNASWERRQSALRATIPLDAHRDWPSWPPTAAAQTPDQLSSPPSAGLAFGHRIAPGLFDPLAAIVVGTLGVLEIVNRKPTPHLPVPDEVLPGVLLMLAFAATLLVRRRWTLAGFVAVLALTLLIGLPFVRKSDAIQLVIAVYLFTIASRYSWRVTGPATAGALVAEIPHLNRVDWTCLCVVVILAFVVAAVATGRVARRRDALNAELRRRVQEVARQRDRQAQLAVSDERRRIAREMHDVVAHRLSILVLQAGAAAGLVARDRGQARRMLDEIADSAHGLCDELQALLGDDDHDDSGVPDVQSLVADARKAGLRVTVVEDDTAAASPGVRVVASRIVQEALTNVRKHAPGARVTVRLKRDHNGLHVEVCNTAPHHAQAMAEVMVATGAGHGLIGIRERVRMFDGDVEAHTDDDGGFTLRASLPEPAHLAP